MGKTCKPKKVTSYDYNKKGKVLCRTSKKLVLILATFILVTEASKKDNDIVLNKVLYIYYLLRFRKDKKNKVQLLNNSGNKVNMMTPVYALKLGPKVCHTDIKALKINSSTFKTFKILLTSFQAKNKLKQARFFQETFLFANLSVEVVLKMPYLTFNKANVSFLD